MTDWTVCGVMTDWMVCGVLWSMTGLDGFVGYDRLDGLWGMTDWMVCGVCRV